MEFFKKILFFPLSQIFRFFTSLRNFLYEFGILKRKIYNTKIISVGYLIMGGAGKTPTVEYISRYLLKKNIFFSIISRGYKRKTKGFIIASKNDNFRTIGDEPNQYFNKFKNHSEVMVSEDSNIALKYCDDNNIDYVIHNIDYVIHAILYILDILNMDLYIDIIRIYSTF